MQSRSKQSGKWEVGRVPDIYQNIRRVYTLTTLGYKCIGVSILRWLRHTVMQCCSLHMGEGTRDSGSYAFFSGSTSTSVRTTIHNESISTTCALWKTHEFYTKVTHLLQVCNTRYLFGILDGLGNLYVIRIYECSSIIITDRHTYYLFSFDTTNIKRVLDQFKIKQ